ncbi:MAG: LD-carboxypeptidase [Bacteroidales bacterium]|nr:LD-carboxypeptidase [Lachnoclostridium sp.]MCM1382918.1 LD-carboxypeptidase [Lachnoclostridium sp.]MCM1465924.1 LD-carboxypeptidase [Bacteroidales bacterium]
MKYPKNLEQGGTIGFVAPSFGCQIEPYLSGFENAKKKFMEMGYQLDIGPNCYAGEGIGISNTPEKCAAELMSYYVSERNDCLISCGGGELMCEVLSHMDFEAIKNAKPKWYMGYSDNTNMTYLLATLCDTASIYGPCAAAFGMEPWHEAIQDAFELLTGKRNTVRGYDKWEKESLKNEENPLEPYHVTEKRRLKSYLGNVLVENAVFQGRLLGGCMDCLVNLLGTRFDKTKEFLEKYKEDGIIWFLEACDLNVFAIRRAMWQMEEAGWFRYVKGFLVGRPLCFGQEMMGLDAYRAVLEVAGRKNVPVIMDVDLGHLPPMMPLTVGSMAVVRVRENDMEIEQQYI